MSRPIAMTSPAPLRTSPRPRSRPRSLLTRRSSGSASRPCWTANTAQNAPVPNKLIISGNGTSQEGGGAIRLGNRALMTGDVTLAGDSRIFGGNGVAFPGIKADNNVDVDPGDEFSGV